MSRILMATAETTPNIAVVKYWGKRDEKKNLPHLSSLSFTMDRTLLTRSTIALASDFEADEAWLQGKKLEAEQLEEIRKQVDPLRSEAGVNWKFRLVSQNSFPTRAGLASSASGFAALTLATAKALGLKKTMTELSQNARLVSGSACRSLFGGFVEWCKGRKSDGSDCYAKQIADENHWPDLLNIIAVVDEREKKILSRVGMQLTVKTSRLYWAHVQDNDRFMRRMKNAVRNRNFAKFAQITEEASNRLHAVLLDTLPPLLYLNDRSREIIERVTELNQKGYKCAYTFDAGPNAHLFTLREYQNEVLAMLRSAPGIEKILVCNIGSGPQYSENHLLDEKGQPRLAAASDFS